MSGLAMTNMNWWSAAALVAGVCVTHDAVAQKGAAAKTDARQSGAANANMVATAADSAIVRGVLGRLLQVTPRPDVSYPWPPTWVIEPEKENPDDPNAFATPDGRVVVTPAILHTIIKGNADFLAMVVGHELSHHILHHVTVQNHEKNDRKILLGAGGRHDETEADSLGALLAIRAGYSWTKILQGISSLASSAPGQDYATVEALRSDHPSWNDRAAFINGVRGNAEQTKLWRNMNAFRNGNYFLLAEQYELAARSYRAVVKEFPDAAEAWANLGFAELMLYCDKLEPDDIRRYGIAQPMIAGFYRRPASLEAKVRGVDQELWWDAVGAMREAIRINPSLTLAKSNLGLAYLVHPSGAPEVGTATRFLDEAVSGVAKDTLLDPMSRVAVYVNAGVAQLAAGRPDSAQSGFRQARNVIASAFAGTDLAWRTNTLSAAIDLDEGWVLTQASDAAQRAQGAAKIETWLTTASASSPWWGIAYDRYSKAMTDAGQTAKAATVLQARATVRTRPIVEVPVGNGQTVMLAEPTAGVKARLGAADELPAVPGTNVVWLSYAARGVTLLASDQILAVSLKGESAPAITVKSSGMGGAEKQVRIGMTDEEVVAALGDDYEMKKLQADMPAFRYYRRAGLGVRVRGGKVEELFIAAIPDA